MLEKMIQIRIKLCLCILAKGLDFGKVEFRYDLAVLLSI